MSFARIVRMIVATAVAAAVTATILLLIVQADVSRFDALTAQPAGTGAGDGVTLTWLGNTNVLIGDGHTSILIDGWFTRPSTFAILFGRIEPDADAIEAALVRAGVTQLAAVVTVHSHFDHAMDAPVVARRTGAALLGSQSTANIGRGAGLAEAQIRVATPGTSETFGAFTVTLIESRHFVFPNFDVETGAGAQIATPLIPPARATAYAEGGSYSILVQHARGSVLVQGSAGFLPRSLANIDVDALVLGVGGISGQTEGYQRDYWTHVVDAVQPEAIYPVHWDSFTHALSDTPQPPNLFWDRVFGLHAADSIEYALERGGPRVHLLPMWRPVVLQRNRGSG